MSRRLALVALPLAMLVAPLAACTGSTRIPPPEPPSQTQPLFASDDEALAAATAAYEEYLAVSNAVTAEPGGQTDVLRSLVTVDYWTELEEQISQLLELGLQTQGRTTLLSSNLQQVIDEPTGTAVFVNACLDVTSVRVIDAEGVDRTPADRDNLVSLQVEFVTSSPESSKLLVASSESWGGVTSCS